MSGPFGAMDIATTGLGFNKYWLDTIAQNVANTDTVVSPGEDPFRARIVVASPVPAGTAPGGGVYVSDVLDQEGDPAPVHDPDNPLADEDGYVLGAVVDLASQLADLVIASRAYQANLSVLTSARESLEAAATLGRR